MFAIFYCVYIFLLICESSLQLGLFLHVCGSSFRDISPSKMQILLLLSGHQVGGFLESHECYCCITSTPTKWCVKDKWSLNGYHQHVAKDLMNILGLMKI